MEKKLRKDDTAEQERFVEGRDYYFENGLLVMTESYLRRRGYCCKNGCRHCPYGFDKALKEEDR
jgi:hypothetical protein